MSSPRLVFGESVARYVAERVNTEIFPPYTTIGLERDGKVIAGTIFNTYTGHDVEVTVAGERGAFTRGYIRAVGHYVFKQLCCLRMSITTNNPDVMAIALRLGARREGCKRDFYGKGKDASLFGILRDDWKLQ